MLKAIHAQEKRDVADQKAHAIVEHLRAARMNTAADLVERSVSETLVGALPDGQSCLNLAAARLRYIAGTSAKCYMNMRPLYQPQVMQPEAVA
ncbi:MAG: hypothetical protein ACREDT_02635 [Methylocella sp.]